MYYDYDDDRDIMEKNDANAIIAFQSTSFFKSSFGNKKLMVKHYREQNVIGTYDWKNNKTLNKTSFDYLK